MQQTWTYSHAWIPTSTSRFVGLGHVDLVLELSTSKVVGTFSSSETLFSFPSGLQGLCAHTYSYIHVKRRYLLSCQIVACRRDGFKNKSTKSREEGSKILSSPLFSEWRLHCLGGFCHQYRSGAWNLKSHLMQGASQVLNHIKLTILKPWRPLGQSRNANPNVSSNTQLLIKSASRTLVLLRSFVSEEVTHLKHSFLCPACSKPCVWC